MGQLHETSAVIAGGSDLISKHSHLAFGGFKIGHSAVVAGYITAVSKVGRAGVRGGARRGPAARLSRPPTTPPRRPAGPTPRWMAKVSMCCLTSAVAGGAAYVLWRAPTPHPNATSVASTAAATASVLTGRSGWALAGVVARGHYLSSAWCLMPHPDKVYKGGEDAAFGCDNAVGVADGVGGWASRGVDPGKYSKGLMEAAHKAAEVAPAPRTPSPTRLLRQAYDVVEAKKIMGSTTAIVATLVSEGPTNSSLHYANVGDSGILVLRPAAADGGGWAHVQQVFRSVEQQHQFNFPFQLGTGSQDKPEHADARSIPVQEGDLVMLGTDGLFDNLFDEELIELVKTAAVRGADEAALFGEASLMQLAEMVARAAQLRANDSEADCPFAVGARAAGYSKQIGGKLDDITVLIAQVMPPSVRTVVAAKL